jgi:PAS domain S-box-containing protein
MLAAGWVKSFLSCCLLLSLLFALASPTNGAPLDSREFIAGIPRFWPPQYSLDDSGNPTGFAIDILNEIAARAGVRVTYRVMDSFAEVSEAMDAGDIDLIPNSGITPDRAAKYDFTAPVETFVVSIFVRDDTLDIRGEDDLRGHRVGVVEFNMGQRLMRDRDDLELMVYRDAETALFSLVAGYVEAVIYPQPVLLNLARQVGIENRIAVVGVPLREIKRGIRVQKGEFELLAALNQAVTDFVGTPAYQAIYVKWYGALQPFWTVSRVILAMGALAVFVLIAMSWWRYRSVLNLNRDLLESVGERERAEEISRESQTRAKAAEEELIDAIESISEGFVLFNPDGRLVLCNRKYKELYGYSDTEAAPGAHTRDLGKLDLESGRVVLGSEDPEAYLSRRDHPTDAPLKSYTIHLAEDRYLQTRDRRTAEGGIVSIQTDITERKRAERALMESEERFRVITEASPVPLIITRRSDGNILYANPKVGPAFGLAADEVVGRSMTEFYGDSSGREERLAALDKDGYVRDNEIEMRKADGSPISTIHSLQVIEYQGEEAVLGGFYDITERKRAEELSARFGRIIERSVNEVYVFDAGTLRFVQVNQGARSNLGYTMKELATLTPIDLKPELTPERFGEFLRPLRDREKEQITFETIHKRKDGTTYEVEVRLQLLTEEVPPVFVAIIQDITKRKHLEEQLRQAQKMEAVGQLTAGVAHDFNNMLAVIWGNAEVLEDEFGKDNPHLAAVFRATKRGADLTQRLLAFSRRQVLNPEIINANKFIADITDLLRRTLEEHIDIETVTGAGLWNCEVDPAQLENALVNLGINARDAMPDGGKLTIETANVRLDDDYAAAQADVRPGQYVMLAVTDTGSGMPPEVREHVFEPFFTTKDVGKGTGLGLSMVYGFVKQSGGYVTIYSEESEGTTIKLYLPRSTATEAVERKPATDEVPIARGETVLVVEDDTDVRTLLLTDVMLAGGMDGPELAAEAEQCTPGIPVLYMSGYTEDAIMHHGRLDAGAELLQKPFRRADLAGAVRRALDGPSA